MSHPSQQYFIEQVKHYFPEHFDNKFVGEFGSLNINGTVRDYFTNCRYIGYDLGKGPGVDVIQDAAEVHSPDETFDVMISTELFEHAERWQDIFVNMHRLVKDKGIVIFTCAGYNRPEHGTSNSDVGSSPLTVAMGREYYGNLAPADFEDNLHMADMFPEYQLYDNQENYDLYFVGFKQSGNQEKLNELTHTIKDWLGDKLVNV